MIFLSNLDATPFLIAILFLLILKLFFSRPKNLPPGPTGVPLLGYFPFLSKIPYMKMRDLSLKYGGVFSMNVVGTRVIHLGTYEAIRDAFIRQGNEFTGRPTGFSFFRWVANDMGIAQAEGEPWRVHRRFALHTLRDFGYGKLSLEGRIQKIAGHVIKVLEETNGQPFDVQELLANATANVMCSLLFDSNFTMDDPVFLKIRHCVRTIVFSLPGSDAFLSGPLVKILPIKYVPGGRLLTEVKKDFYDVVTELIKKHQERFDHTFLSDYVDAYLAEMRNIELDGKAEKSTFTIERLQTVVLNLFIAGTESSANAIYWLLRFLILNPEKQRKIQAEIDEVVGNERLPSTMDRPQMPYTEAANNEVLRISTLAPMALFHSNPEEVNFWGYVIPKRSIILANLWAIHHDPKYWPKPDEFEPNRFLNAEGKLVKRESFYPFSAGKRFCLGESLARMELFLFPAAIMQHFTITPAEGDTDTSMKLKPGFFRTLMPYKLCARRRH